MELIKYSNRKLYSNTLRRYIGLPEVIEGLKRGEDLTVIDYDTKKDITEKVLAQAVLEAGFSELELMKLFRAAS